LQQLQQQGRLEQFYERFAAGHYAMDGH